MLEILGQIFEQVQSSESTHDEYMRTLMDIYEKSSVDEFVENFVLILRKTFRHDIDKNNVQFQCALDFLSKCTAEIFCNENTEKQEQATFLPKLLEKVIPFCDSNYPGTRYHSCLFVSQLVNYLQNVNLDDSSSDMIQETMWKKLEYEHSLDIRLQAISTLSKFQHTRKGRPIIEAFLKYLKHSDSAIRRSVIDVINISTQTLPAITDKLRDVDAEVRCICYIRLGLVGPFLMDTLRGLFILNTGLHEEDPKVKRIFKAELLNEWFISYNYNYIRFLRALTLSLPETELFQLASTGKKVLFNLFESTPVANLLEFLPMNDNKLIKDGYFTNVRLLYWYCVIKYLRNVDQYDNYLHQIVPDLTQFCLYIKRMLNENYVIYRNDIAAFEFNIHCLLKILNGYDFSEEVGRRATIILITNILIKYRFNNRKLVEKFVKILSKCYTEHDAFLESVHEILKNVREPITVIRERLNEHEIRNRKVEIIKSVMHITILEIRKKLIIQSGDRRAVGQIQTQIDSLRKKLMDLENECGCDIETTLTRVRIRKTDNVTTRCCLDILIGVMRLSRFDKLSTMLIEFLEDFLLPLARNQNDQIHSRYLECLTLYCVIDGNLALKHYQELFEPIVNCKKSNYSNLVSLRIALISIADLLCLYGTNMTESSDFARSAIENSIAVVLDSALAILDVPDEKGIITAFETFRKLVKVIKFTPVIISHVLLKWFNFLIKENYDIYTKIELFIETFMKFTENSIEIMRESIVPVLSAIVNTPNDDSVSSVHFETVLNFFVTWMNTEDEVNIKASVFDIIKKIADDSNKNIAQLLIKILLRLNVTINSTEERDQYVNAVEILMNRIDDQVAKQYLKEFISKIGNTVSDNELRPVINNEQNNQQSEENTENKINNDDNGNNDKKEENKEQDKPNKVSNVGETDGVVKNKTTPKQIKRKMS